MELSSLNSLTTVTFKGLHNQEISYAELFSGKRILIFSLPLVLSPRSVEHLIQYRDNCKLIVESGIDDVYCVSSWPYIIPVVEECSKEIRPLVDHTAKFTEYLKEYAGSSVNIDELVRRWQYVAIINDGKIEKMFNNTLKANMSLSVYNNPLYQYYRLDTNTIVKYLVSC